MSRLSIRQWKCAFSRGMFKAPDRETQIKAGWYDWFCKDCYLKGKTEKLARIIMKIERGGKVDVDRNYVWFKNCLPLRGPMYDVVKIADLEDLEVQFTINIGDEREGARYAVYGRLGGHGTPFSDEPLFKCASLQELVRWLNTK